MLLLAYCLPTDYKMDRTTFYQYVDMEIELFYNELAPGTIERSCRSGFLYPESHIRSFEIWHFTYSFTRRLENHYYMSYEYNRLHLVKSFFYNLWVRDQNLQYELTGVAPVRLTHSMEGLQQPLPVLIDDVPPDPPLDPESNVPHQLANQASHPIRHYDIVPEPQPEPVPVPASVARCHILESPIVPPKKKTRKVDAIDLCNSSDNEEKPVVINLTNDDLSDRKKSDCTDSNPGNDNDDKKLPAV